MISSSRLKPHGTRPDDAGVSSFHLQSEVMKDEEHGGNVSVIADWRFLVYPLDNESRYRPRSDRFNALGQLDRQACRHNQPRLNNRLLAEEEKKFI